MRFVYVVGFIVIVCAGAMYKYNPSQFNTLLAKAGVTSWRAPDATSTATDQTSGTAAAASPAAPAVVGTKAN